LQQVLYPQAAVFCCKKIIGAPGFRQREKGDLKMRVLSMVTVLFFLICTIFAMPRPVTKMKKQK
jgi:hypothetical protein